MKNQTGFIDNASDKRKHYRLRENPVVIQAARISKPDFASIFLLSRQGRPGDQTVDPEELSRVLTYYDTLSSDVADEMVRDWRHNPDLIATSRVPRVN